MDQHSYDSLSRKAEFLAANHPAQYRWYLWFWSKLGYVIYYGALLCTLVSLVALVVFLILSRGSGFALIAKIILVLLAFSFVLLVGMFNRWPLPDEERIKQHEAPDLYREIDQLRKKLGAPKIEAVLLNYRFNATAICHRKYIWIGKRRFFVILGLPLMIATTREELMGIVAHELAHHAHGDTAEGMATYQSIMMWEFVARAQGSNKSLFRKFVDWYSPRLHAISQVMSRDCELQADARASEIYGSDTIANGLMRIEIFAKRFYQYWESVRSQVSESETPIGDFYEQMEREFALPISADEITSYADSLKPTSTRMDSHPSHRERLAALGQNVSGPFDVAAARLAEKIPEVSTSALRAMFGSQSDARIQASSKAWKSEFSDWWTTGRKTMQKISEVMTSLEARDISTHSETEAIQYADALGNTNRYAEAETYLRRSIEFHRNSSHLKMLLGYSLAYQDNPEALNIFEDLQKRDPTRACDAIAGQVIFYERKGDRQKAYELSWKHDELKQKEAQMRETLLKSSNGIWKQIADREFLANLQGVLGGNKDLLEIYAFDLNDPARTYVNIRGIVLLFKPDFFDEVSAKNEHFVHERLADFDLEDFTLFVATKSSGWKKRLAAAKIEPIYKRQ